MRVNEYDVKFAHDRYHDAKNGKLGPKSVEEIDTLFNEWRTKQESFNNDIINRRAANARRGRVY